MNIIYIAFLLALADGSLACYGCHYEPRFLEASAELQEVASGLDAFAINCLKVLSRSMDNYVFSPLSAGAELALLRLGAGGESADQISAALGLPYYTERVRSGYRALLDALTRPPNDSSDALLRIADGFYHQEEFDVKQMFKETAIEDFKSDVQEFDFSDSQNARNTINMWVEDFTNDKITDIIPEDFLTDDTRLVLVNAIYFSAQWQNPFLEQDTRTEPFHVSNTEQVYVPMMHGAFHLPFAEIPQLDATAVGLPYEAKNIKAEFLILLPNAVDGLEYLESKLREIDESKLQFDRREVIVTIPKFRVETTLQLKSMLQQMGVKQIFTSEADLSGISNKKLYVNDAIQKSFIVVNENGTEAAAATAAQIVELSSPPQRDFVADHPFLFLVRAEYTTLFAGRMIDPSQ